MANPPDPLRVHARGLLADGEWHRYLEVQADLMKLIKPGEARRQAESERKWAAKRDGGPEQRVRPRTDEALILSGKTSITRKILAYKKDFEIVTRDDDEKWIRLRSSKQNGKGVKGLHGDRVAIDEATNMSYAAEEV